MRRTKKTYFYFFILLIALLGLGLIGYQKFAKAGHSLTKTSIVTPKDRLPINIPKSSIKNGRAVTVPILMYHHVGQLPNDPDATRKDLTVPTADFQNEVSWMASQGYQTITLQDLYLYSQGKFTLPKKPIVFTFDDGYEDVFQNAVPILKQYGYSGSFGIITHFVGQTQGTNIYASWTDIEAAQQNGMEIVSHTQNHFDGSNPKFDASYIYSNLSGAKNDLAEHGIQTNILIYPYGHYTPEYLEQEQKAGYVMGVTVEQGDVTGFDNLFSLPRVRVHGGEDLQRFKDILNFPEGVPLAKSKPNPALTAKALE